jgi:hypothetical protein
MTSTRNRLFACKWLQYLASQEFVPLDLTRHSLVLLHDTTHVVRERNESTSKISCTALHYPRKIHITHAPERIRFRCISFKLLKFETWHKETNTYTDGHTVTAAAIGTASVPHLTRAGSQLSDPTNTLRKRTRSSFCKHQWHPSQLRTQMINYKPVHNGLLSYVKRKWLNNKVTLPVGRLTIGTTAD